ncbi:MAG: CHASE3 domain-containing protein, partial [Rhodoferax sp.]
MKTLHKTTISLVALTLIMAAGVMFTFWAYQEIEEASNHRRDSRVVIIAAQDLLASIVDAETGQRGYALTRDTDYLEPYLAAR